VVFLTARWRHLVMLNYAVDPGVLESHVPRGTAVDSWNGTTYVSLVAFSFLGTRGMGLPVPLHRDFEEINLRFYVRARGPEGMRRGVVFVREVVPRRAIALVARWLYNESYVARPTRSTIAEPSAEGGGSATYAWKHAGSWLTIGAEYAGAPVPPPEGSEAEFITQHYWGYASQRDGGTVEYRVEHPRWRIWPATSHVADGDFAGFYGTQFSATLGRPPTSVFVAEGSPVVVHGGARLRSVS
jgi:uncharacterized protein YqjF (DUF2071 family)